MTRERKRVQLACHPSNRLQEELMDRELEALFGAPGLWALPQHHGLGYDQMEGVSLRKSLTAFSFASS